MNQRYNGFYSGFTPGTPVFTHFTSAWRRYALVTQKDRKKIERVTEMDIKKNTITEHNAEIH